ncbi:hypothetical protein N7532_003365 [Penicillium argentinense]|uniref:Uncharacterized protein n=1 Tax=Penicillium argentinense TaxID=1131581 RepID=A0A9W9FMC3_9EURO|nr:uncharacterized protein N7532_003365 [Penicillium argentinense]KAJ5102836.1 hypothetical protein N7532_003365 [Penicillium argentinense]
MKRKQREASPEVEDPIQCKRRVTSQVLTSDDESAALIKTGTGNAENPFFGKTAVKTRKKMVESEYTKTDLFAIVKGEMKAKRSVWEALLHEFRLEQQPWIPAIERTLGIYDSMAKGVENKSAHPTLQVKLKAYWFKYMVELRRWKNYKGAYSDCESICR